MKAAIATVVFLLSCLFAFGQTSSSSTYLIRKDDVLRIEVYGEQQASDIVTVGSDGYVSAPFAGMVKAEGRTTDELVADLTQLYMKNLRLRDPKVSVTFDHYAPLRAWAGGAVGKPGEFDFRPGDTIVILIHFAGDPTDLGNQHRAILYHKGMAEGIPIDLFNILRRGDLTQNYPLQDGDRLEIPIDTTNQVQVVGYVQRPGILPYREPMTLADAIAEAGGEIQGKSRLSKIVIMRQSQGSPGRIVQIKPDFVAYEHGDASQNVLLQPKDFIFVPATNTPDLSAITNAVSSIFYIDSVLRTGFFGLRLP